jgi:hypothetical protein
LIIVTKIVAKVIVKFTIRFVDSNAKLDLVDDCVAPLHLYPSLISLTSISLIDVLSQAGINSTP